MNVNSPFVIVIVGLQFSGKTTIGRELAARLVGSHHIDDDDIRHGLFPRSSVISTLADRRKVFRHVTSSMLGAAAINLEIGFSPILSSTFSHENAKRPMEKFWAEWRSRASFHFCELVIPEGCDALIRERAVQRYGTDQDILEKKLARREHVKSITAPWSDGINPMIIDATQSIEHICQQIIQS